MVRVSLQDDHHGQRQPLISVIDTGIGIPAESRLKLFDPFTQADGTTTRRFGGTGLGLTISRKLVGLMGGEIGVKSSEGQGSEFWFTLSAETVAKGKELAGRQSDQNAQKDKAVIQLVSETTHRVLLVDDNLVNRKVAAGMLKKLGLAVEMAEDGQQAVDILSQQEFDLVLMDCMMPNMDGYIAKPIKKDLVVQTLSRWLASESSDKASHCIIS